MTSPDRGTSPLPGESSLTLRVFAVASAIGLVSLLAYGAAMIWGAASTAGLWVVLCFVAVSLGGLLYAIVTRARHLARVRNGDVIEREPWSGADLLPPG